MAIILLLDQCKPTQFESININLDVVNLDFNFLLLLTVYDAHAGPQTTKSCRLFCDTCDILNFNYILVVSPATECHFMGTVDENPWARSSF